MEPTGSKWTESLLNFDGIVFSTRKPGLKMPVVFQSIKQPPVPQICIIRKQTVKFVQSVNRLSFQC